MNDAALSEAALQVSLIDIRLPPLSTMDRLADLFAAMALGGLAALIVVALFRLLSRRVRQSVAPPMDLAALRALPEDRRRVALLHLLRTHAPERFAALKGALYRPEGAVDLEALQAEVARHV